MIRRSELPPSLPLPELLGGVGEGLADGGTAQGAPGGAPVDDALAATRERDAAAVIAQLLGVRDQREAVAPTSSHVVVPERPPRLDELLLGHAVPRALDPAVLGSALAAFLRRPVRPGETERLRKLRRLVARVLELKQDAGAGAARISIG